MTQSKKVGRNPFDQKKMKSKAQHGQEDLLKVWKNNPLKSKKIRSLDDLLSHREEITQFTRQTLLALTKKVKKDYLDPYKGFAPRPLRDILDRLG